MVVDQSDGYPGRRTDAAHRYARVPVALQAAQRRVDERLAAHLRGGTTKFGDTPFVGHESPLFIAKLQREPAASRGRKLGRKAPSVIGRPYSSNKSSDMRRRRAPARRARQGRPLVGAGGSVREGGWARPSGLRPDDTGGTRVRARSPRLRGSIARRA